MAQYLKLSGMTLTDLTAPKALTTYARDDFNRADGPLVNTADGKPYIQQYGANLTIIGNQLGATGIVNPSNPQAMGAKAVIDAGTADVELSITMVAGQNRIGPIFRVGADWTGYRITGNGPNQTELHKIAAGGGNGTVIKTWAGFGISAGMVLKVILSGDNISIYRNGTLLETVVDASHKGTRHGFWISDNNHRLDDLLITSLK